MEIKKSNPLTVAQLQTIVDSLNLLEQHALAICEGCMFRHKKNDCPLFTSGSETASYMCFDKNIWSIDFMVKNIRSLLVREQIKAMDENVAALENNNVRPNEAFKAVRELLKECEEKLGIPPREDTTNKEEKQ